MKQVIKLIKFLQKQGIKIRGIDIRGAGEKHLEDIEEGIIATIYTDTGGTYIVKNTTDYLPEEA